MLIELALSREQKNVETQSVSSGRDGILYQAPASYAIRALSQIVPDPPMTYNNPNWELLMLLEPEIWEAWWEKNRSKYENSYDPIPEPTPNSLRLLSKEERAEKEKERFDEIYAKLSELALERAELEARGTKLKITEVIDGYLEEKRAERAKNAATVEEIDPTPHTLQDPTPPPPTESSLIGKTPPKENPTPSAVEPEAEKSTALLSVLLGLLVAAILVVALRKARKQ